MKDYPERPNLTIQPTRRAECEELAHNTLTKFARAKIIVASI
jgi:hypothetical protein